MGLEKYYVIKILYKRHENMYYTVGNGNYICRE